MKLFKTEDLESLISELKQSANKATPGPWKKACATSGHSIYEDDINENLAACGPSHYYEDDKQYSKVIADSEFISLLNPQTALILLDLIELYRKVLLSIYQASYSESEVSKAEAEILARLDQK